ncbi:hypothetical protein ACLOJK_026682 [Asimina triloba]
MTLELAPFTPKKQLRGHLRPKEFLCNRGNRPVDSHFGGGSCAGLTSVRPYSGFPAQKPPRVRRFSSRQIFDADSAAAMPTRAPNGRRPRVANRSRQRGHASNPRLWPRGGAAVVVVAVMLRQRREFLSVCVTSKWAPLPFASQAGSLTAKYPS